MDWAAEPCGHPFRGLILNWTVHAQGFGCNERFLSPGLSSQDEKWKVLRVVQTTSLFAAQRGKWLTQDHTASQGRTGVRPWVSYLPVSFLLMILSRIIMGIENNYSKPELLCTGALRNPEAQGPKFCRGRKVKVKVTQPCPTLRILQARTLEWVPFPSPGDLSNQESFFTSWAIREAPAGGGRFTKSPGAPWLACLVLGMTPQKTQLVVITTTTIITIIATLSDTSTVGALWNLSLLSLTRVLQEECLQSHFPQLDTEHRKGK